MRAAMTVMALAVLGCTAPNPDFGDTSSGTGTTSGADTSTATTTSPTVSTTMPETTQDPTTDPSTSTDTVDPATTGEPSVECCDHNDCADGIYECVCMLAEQDCCTGTWGPTCPNIAIACGGVCEGEVHPCCEPRRDEPACTGIQNLGGFCLVNFDCCLAEWEPHCVVLYDAATDGSCGLESCEVPHESPSCNDAGIVECVCDQLPLCCTEQWHNACVEAAASC